MEKDLAQGSRAFKTGGVTLGVRLTIGRQSREHFGHVVHLVSALEAHSNYNALKKATKSAFSP